MRKILFVLVSTAAFGLAGVAAGHAMPLGAGGSAIKDAAEFHGFRGANRGLCRARPAATASTSTAGVEPAGIAAAMLGGAASGWGGVYGWMGWEYAPAARKFGRGSVTIRESSRGFRGRDHDPRRQPSRTAREGVQRRGSATTREGASGTCAVDRAFAARPPAARARMAAARSAQVVGPSRPAAAARLAAKWAGRRRRRRSCRKRRRRARRARSRGRRWSRGWRWSPAVAARVAAEELAKIEDQNDFSPGSCAGLFLLDEQRCERHAVQPLT